jgi:hypothetical protein
MKSCKTNPTPPVPIQNDKIVLSKPQVYPIQFPLRQPNTPSMFWLQIIIPTLITSIVSKFDTASPMKPKVIRLKIINRSITHLLQEKINNYSSFDPEDFSFPGRNFSQK